jgi:UDP-glucose 4-epimerase
MSLPEAVIVFGASGFVGRNIVESLKGRIPTLIGVTGASPSVPGCTETVTLDRVGELADLPKDAVAIHVANYRYDATRFELTQSDIIRHNSDLNTRIYQFCAERRINEVRMASSVAVYPGALSVMDDAVPVDLNAPPHQGEAFYAWSKRWAEVLAGLYAQRFGINSVIFRLSNPYGPYDSTNPAKAHVAPAFVMKALSDAPVFEVRGDPMVERDFIYVGDVVQAFQHTLNWRGRSEVYNLCTGDSITLQETAETILRVAKVDKPIQAGAPGAFGPARRVSTSARVKEALGLEFTTLENGMMPTIEWYRNALA